MKQTALLKRSLVVGIALWVGILLVHKTVSADPSKYPQFAQQKLPDNITPAFVSVDQLAKEIAAGEQPLIIDVRSAKEYRELHISGAVSAPLSEFSAHLEDIPRNRPVVLY